MRQWGAAQECADLDDPQRCAAAVADLVTDGLLDLPHPGSGATGQRLDSLSVLGGLDLGVARLAEGHVDAVAIQRELGGRLPSDGELWGVWAADPPRQRVQARWAGPGWRLEGLKPWCSGAHACTRALVTAHAEDGYRLFVVDPAGERVSAVDGSWPAFALAGTDSRTVSFDDAAAEPVGAPGAYLTRPGFWHGAVGVAAVWLGGAEALAVALCRGSRPLDEHALAHAGAVDATLHAAAVVLAEAGAAIDADPDDGAGVADVRARRVRAVVERAATEVLDRVGRALGATPLAADRAHGRRVADLGLYLRQSHAERDLAELGRRIRGQQW